MIGCHIDFSVHCRDVRARQSGPAEERGIGGKRKVHLGVGGSKYLRSKKSGRRCAREYLGIGLFCNEYPGIPERTIRHRATLLNNGVTL